MTENINIKINADGSKAVSEINKVASAATKLKDVKVDVSVKGAKEASASLAEMVNGYGRVGGAASIAVTGIAAVGAAMYGVAQAAEKINQTIRPIKFLSGKDEAANLAFLRAEANKAGQSFVDLAGSYKGFAGALKGSGVSFTDINKQFAQITEGATVLGLTNEQLGGTFLALEQVTSKGKVSLEELNGQLAERVPGALGIAARAYGVTTKELLKMVNAGLDGAQFTKLFAAELEKETGSGLAKSVNTLTGAQNRLKTATDEITLSLGEAFSPAATKGIDFITAAVNNLNKAIQSNLRYSKAKALIDANNADGKYSSYKAEELASGTPSYGALGFDLTNGIGDAATNSKPTGKTVTGEKIKYTGDDKKKKVKKESNAAYKDALREGLEDEKRASEESYRIQFEALTKQRELSRAKIDAIKNELDERKGLADRQRSINRKAEEAKAGLAGLGGSSIINNLLAANRSVEREVEDAHLDHLYRFSKREEEIAAAHEEALYKIKEEGLKKRQALDNNAFFYKGREIGNIPNTVAGKGNNIASNAASLIGLNTSNISGTEAGRKACAYVVTRILADTFKDPSLRTNSVAVLLDNLKKNPNFKQVNSAGSGDVVIAKGNGKSHTGIVGADGSVIANSTSNTGVTKQFPNYEAWLKYFGNAPEYIFRAVDKGVTSSIVKSNRPYTGNAGVSNSAPTASIPALKNNVREENLTPYEQYAKQLEAEKAIREFRYEGYQLEADGSKITLDTMGIKLESLKKANVIGQYDKEIAEAEKQIRIQTLAVLDKGHATRVTQLEEERKVLEAQLKLAKDANAIAAIQAGLRNNALAQSNENSSYKSSVDGVGNTLTSAEETKLSKKTEELTRYKDLVRGVSSDISGAFKDIAVGGKSLEETLSDVFSSISNRFLDMAAKMIENSIFDAIFGSGGSGGLLGGLLGGIVPHAKGAVIYQGKEVPMFAKGGITNSPVQIAGEAGPEAIVPLPDGRSIPVQLSGSAGQSSGASNINLTVVVNTEVKSSGNAEQDKRFANDISEQIRSVASQEIASALKPGGQIYAQMKR